MLYGSKEVQLWHPTGFVVPRKKTRNAMHGFITSVSHKLEALSIAYIYIYVYIYIYIYISITCKRLVSGSNIQLSRCG